jgi:hypothetical protein
MASADSTNKHRDNRSFSGSGLTAGVESGLSSVSKTPRGKIPKELESQGELYRQDHIESSAGSKNGKNFKFSR